MHPATPRLGLFGGDLPLRRRRRLHGHGAGGKPARRLHRRTWDRHGDDAGAHARDRVLGDDLRAPGRIGRPRSHQDLQPPRGDALRGPSDARLGVRPRRAPAARGHRARDGSRSRRGRPRARRLGADRVRAHGAAGARGARVRRHGGALRSAGRRCVGGAGGALRQRRDAYPGRAVERGRRRSAGSRVGGDRRASA